MKDHIHTTNKEVKTMKTVNEQWKTIQGYSRYEVSSLGKIKNEH